MAGGRDMDLAVPAGVGLAGLAQEQVPAALGERQDSGGARDRVRTQRRAEPPVGHLDRKDGHLVVAAVLEQQLPRGVGLVGKAAPDGEPPVLVPGQGVDEGPHRLVAQLHVPGGVGEDEQFAACADGVAARRGVGADREGRPLVVPAYEADTPRVGLAGRPGVVGPGARDQFQAQLGGEGAPRALDSEVVRLLGVPVLDAQRLEVAGRPGGEFTLQPEGAAGLLVPHQPGLHPLGPQPEPARAEPGRDAQEVVQITHGQLGEPAHPHGPGAQQAASEGGHLDVPGGARPLGDEPGRVDDRLEPGPVVTVQPLLGAVGGLAGADGTDLQGHRAPLARPQPRELGARPDPARRQVPYIGEPLEPQPSVLVPGRLGDVRLQRQIGPPEGGHATRQGPGDGRELRPAPARPARQERRAVALLVRHEREQLGQAALPDELPLDAQGQRKTGEDGRVDGVREGVGVVEEGLVVLGVAERQRLHEQPQVPGEHRRVVTPLALRPARRLRGAGRLARPVPEEAADRADGGGAVGDGARPGPPVGDGAVPVAPQIDGPGQDVDAAGEEVRGHHDRGVLEEHAHGEREGVAVPEVLAEHLVAGDAVPEQVPVPGDVGGGAVLAHHLAEHGGLLGRPVDAQPVHIAGGEVGARLLQGVEHALVRVVRHHVVAVHEGEMRARGPRRTRVARRSEARVLLPDVTEARVAPGHGTGDLRTPVGGAVVDHHDFEVGHGLCGERLQAGVEVRLDVVDGDDDRESGCHALRTFLPEN